MNTKLSGNLIIIGGAEDKEGKKEILNRVCDCINKDNDTLIVATVATKYPEEAARKYKKAFGEIGVKHIEILDISKRKDAYKKENISLIKKASLIFFTGGDQLKITSLLPYNFFTSFSFPYLFR